ncbi:hypothetical protein psageK4_110c [Pseudomonas phage psageK4]|uniref:Uncharacterized protein n=1 Tax=Pseudomonas phage psageK4 TaxID=2859563 RepID=A0ABX8SPE8_9CAUD|nr:hypothetical protein QGX14_gp125 [Pseudomonas phage psageK4]QXV71764.1 hypothetical protein psageK4_110c [Pseudomonas phage psageK4]
MWAILHPSHSLSTPRCEKAPPVRAGLNLVFMLTTARVHCQRPSRYTSQRNPKVWRSF